MPLIYGSYSITTGIVDLSPLREVYLHSSLASNRTLHVNGSNDCIARIPIDVGYGEIVTYRHLGPTDALSSSDLHFRTVRKCRSEQLNASVGPRCRYVTISP